MKALVLAADKPYVSAKSGKTYYSGTLRLGTGIGQVSSDIALDEYVDKQVEVSLDFELGFNSKKLVPRVIEIDEA